MPQETAGFYPLKVLWECTRVSLKHQRELSDLLPPSESHWMEYGNFRSWIFHKVPMDNKVPKNATERLEAPIPPIFMRQPCCALGVPGQCTGWRFQASPTSTARYNRREEFPLCESFGERQIYQCGHRPLHISSTCISRRASMHEVKLSLREWLSREHIFLGQFWRVMHFRRHKKNSSSKGDYFEVRLFATHGKGLTENRTDYVHRNAEATVSQAINWLIPLDLNGESSTCKIYSRIELGFSKTYPTIVFRSAQIHEVEDVLGDLDREDVQSHRLVISPASHGTTTARPVMSGRCSRISIAAAREVWRLLGKAGEGPSAFQGRVANAKGL